MTAVYVAAYVLAGLVATGLAVAWAERRGTISRDMTIQAGPALVAASLLWPVAIALLVAAVLLGGVIGLARRTVLR